MGCYSEGEAPWDAVRYLRRGAVMSEFLKGAITFLFGGLTRHGLRLAAIPKWPRTAEGETVCVSGQGETSVIVAVRQAALSDHFDLRVVDDMIALRTSACWPIVLVGLSRLPPPLRARLSQESIQVFQYPETGMKELMHRISEMLAGIAQRQ